ncbi:MAG: hypothetical protein R3C14_17515 [Caldilineaceae bacterium]
MFMLLAPAWSRVAHTQTLSQAKVQPSVVVDDQAIVDGKVTVAEVVTPQDGWIVIHRSQSGNLDAVIGLAPVKAGLNRNVVVTINVDLATETLYALLHSDLGQQGIYEFPGADAPIIVSNPPMLAFHITGLPDNAAAQVVPLLGPVTSADTLESTTHEFYWNEPLWLSTGITAAQLTGQGRPGGVLQVLLDNVVISTTAVSSHGVWTVTLPLEQSTVHTIAVQSASQPFNLYLPLISNSITLQGVVTRAANLRTGPGLTFAIVDQARAQQKITVVACNEQCSWYRLADGKWIAAFLVQGVTDASAKLPHVTSP